MTEMTSTTRCDDCRRELSDYEIRRNRVENAKQDGNAFWCDVCADSHEAEAQEMQRLGANSGDEVET